MATKFGEKYPWPEHNVLLESKVMQGSARVNQRSNSPEMPCATKFGRKDPRPECNAVRSCWGQPKVKLLRNAICLLHVGVIRGQPEGNCLQMHGAIKCSQCYRALCSCRCSSITKIMEYLCVSGYMRFVMLGGMGLKLCMGIGDGPPRLNSIFWKWPHQRSKVIQRSSCLRNTLMAIKFDRKKSWPRSNALLRSKVMQGSSGVNQGQIA